MSSERNRFFIALGAVGVAATTACADFGRGADDPPVFAPDAAIVDLVDGAAPDDGSATNDGAVTISYATAVHALLQSGCYQCHRAGGEAGDTAFILDGTTANDYQAALALIDTATPAQSRLLVKTTGSGHQGGSVYAPSSNEYQTLIRWIQGGAKP